jgi:EpsI family protein
VNGVRAYIPAAILCAGCVFTLAGSQQQTMPLAGSLAVLPRDFGQYHGVDRKVDAEEMRVAGATNYMFRVFHTTDSASAFSVYVGYYENQMHGRSIHSPKNCLPANGWDFLKTEMTTLATSGGPVTVNRTIVVNREQRALVYYWYQGRGRVAANEYRVKWDLFRDAALSGRTEEALVRIVVPFRAGGDVAELDRTAASVARELIPAVTAVLPRWPSA